MKKITHQGEISLKGVQIPCYVTEEGQRLLASRRMQDVLKIAETPETGKQVSGGRLVRFFNQKSLEPLFSGISNRSILKPIDAKYKETKITGYEAKILPEICNLMLKGRRENLLVGSRQMMIAEQCEILLSAFAAVGITALIDEATGYQDIRTKDALQKIIDLYIRKKLSAWTKRFPDEFYKQIFRLKKWVLEDFKRRPAVIGKYTNDLIYDRLAPNIVNELEKKNPKNPRGNRINRHHQWLTNDIGHPALREHLHAVIALMKTCQTWGNFQRLLKRAFPKKNEPIELFIEDTEE